MLQLGPMVFSCTSFTDNLQNTSTTKAKHPLSFNKFQPYYILYIFLMNPIVFCFDLRI